jgi:hypothetical protein
MIDSMRRAGLVTVKNHYITWVGDPADPNPNARTEDTMTMQDINAGVEETETIEELPHEEIELVVKPIVDVLRQFPVGTPAHDAIEEPVPHLAGGASSTTLCGLPRFGLIVRHPSKARKTDCLACRTALRDATRAKMPTPVGDGPRGREFKKDDKIAFEDESAWLIVDVRDGGMDLQCLVASPTYPKGRRITVTKDAFVRLLTDETFSELVGREKPVKASGIVTLPPRGDVVNVTTEPVRASHRGWKPTKEEVANVLALRAAGYTFMAIEAELNWPQGHGNRPYRICKLELKARD